MLSSDFLKASEELGLARPVAAAKLAAAKKTWSPSQTRKDRRPLRVSTMLKKDKEGTLTKYTAGPLKEKDGSFSLPGGTDYSEPDTDPNAAKLVAKEKFPSREGTGNSVKRQDGRDFATTLPGPGVFLHEVGPQPDVIKTSGAGDAAIRAGRLLTGNENAADLAGLGLMAAGGADKLYGEMKGNEGLIGEKGQIATDLAGLGVMALPQLKKLTDPRAGKLEAGAVLGGLGALAIPAADDLQAKIRGGDDKHLLGHGAHNALELAGYGTFGALSAKDMIKSKDALEALHLAGYGTLAAPYVESAVKGHDEPKVFEGKTRALSDLAGLGLLAAPAAMHLKHASLDKEALFERLVRLGATDVGGEAGLLGKYLKETPRMFMRKRSPVELGALQHGVEKAYDSKVTDPLMKVIGKVTNKLPEGKLKTVANKGARLVAEDPLGTLAANLVPVPGAHPGYVVGKKALERGIDRLLPVPLPA